MKSNEIVRKEIFDIIKNQLKNNNPPETRNALNRLKGLGFSEIDAKKHIAQCLAVELFKIFKHNEPFDLLRYTSNLNKLPEEPFDDDNSK